MTTETTSPTAYNLESGGAGEYPGAYDDEVTPAPDLLDAQALVNTLTGFDEIAIRQRFNERFESIAEDQLMLLRVLYFVHLRRENAGTSGFDKVAFQQAMEMPLGALQEKFADADQASDPDDEGAVVERDREFAEFVVTTGLSYTVEQYMALTLSQRNAVYDVASRRR